jgi:hypothetical protein
MTAPQPHDVIHPGVHPCRVGGRAGTLIGSRAALSARPGRSQPGTGSNPVRGPNLTPDRGLSPTRCGQGSGRQMQKRIFY